MRDPDPIVMYLVIRRSLNLSSGKIGAQCGHAVQYLMQEYFSKSFHEFAEVERVRRQLAAEWLQGDHAKITLGATDAEYDQVKAENPNFFKVIDLGYTQVAPDTETALGLWPMRKSARSPILQVLKPLR